MKEYKDNTNDTITLIWIVAVIGMIIITLFATMLYYIQ